MNTRSQRAWYPQLAMPSPAKPEAGKQSAAARPPIYLLDSMAFIFRAYHAMQRQRPMSTRTGIPTAATYVFVNMINKLRKDFAPQYLAAVFDVPHLAFPVGGVAGSRGHVLQIL